MPVYSSSSDNMQSKWNLFGKKQSIIYITSIIFLSIGTVTEELTGCVLSSCANRLFKLMLCLGFPIIVLTLCNSGDFETEISHVLSTAKIKKCNLATLCFYLCLVHFLVRISSEMSVLLSIHACFYFIATVLY